MTIRPIFWRLLIWALVPATLSCMLGNFLYYSTQENSLSMINWSIVVGIALGVTLNVTINRNKYAIVIHEGTLSGMGTGFGGATVTFPVRDLDRESMRKQSFLGKILAFHTLRSTGGQKIMFPHFIYGSTAVDRVYETLEMYPL